VRTVSTAHVDQRPTTKTKKKPKLNRKIFEFILCYYIMIKKAQNKLEISSLDIYCKMHSTSENEILNDPQLTFRFMCYNFNHMMRFVELPIINWGNKLEAVFIEFRPLIHVEFLIRNAIYKLGDKWSFTIICGENNHGYMKQLVSTINRSIKLVKLKNVYNVMPSEYSRLLTTK
jgi:hypothetical protein